MGANTEAAPSVGSVLNRGGKRAWGGELWLCAETSQTTWGLIEIISPAFSFSKAVSMIEVTFSRDYCYYCHTDCSGQGLKVTCGLRMLGCNGRGWWTHGSECLSPPGSLCLFSWGLRKQGTDRLWMLLLALFFRKGWWSHPPFTLPWGSHLSQHQHLHPP